MSYLIGSFFQGLGRYKDAVKDLDAILKLDPNNTGAIRERELLEQLQVGVIMDVVTVILQHLQSTDSGHATIDL